MLRSLLAEGSVVVDVDLLQEATDEAQMVDLGELDHLGHPAPVGVFVRGADTGAIAMVPTALYTEVQAVLKTGFTVGGTLTGASLRLAIDEDELPGESAGE